MGRFAEAVQGHLRDSLTAARPAFEWTTEEYVSGTPVDVAGVAGDRLALIELEWRRADPADNTAKLFRHLTDGALDEYREVTVCQLFTGYYDLATGGVSSKRENAEFVGRVAAERFDRLAYHPLRFDLDPPKRGGEWPDGWRSVADGTATDIASLLADG